MLAVPESLSSPCSIVSWVCTRAKHTARLCHHQLRIVCGYTSGLLTWNTLQLRHLVICLTWGGCVCVLLFITHFSYNAMCAYVPMCVYASSPSPSPSSSSVAAAEAYHNTGRFTQGVYKGTQKLYSEE